MCASCWSTGRPVSVPESRLVIMRDYKMVDRKGTDSPMISIKCDREGEVHCFSAVIQVRSHDWESFLAGSVTTRFRRAEVTG